MHAEAGGQEELQADGHVSHPGVRAGEGLCLVTFVNLCFQCSFCKNICADGPTQHILFSLRMIRVLWLVS